jgi:amidohydrolase
VSPPDLEALRDPLEAWLAAHHDELVTFRRHLHAHPELSGAERETTAMVAERLLVAGLEPRVLPTGTGLLCDVGTGPLIALRADLDALPLEDGKDVPYRSTVPGVAHACGHDVHTTIVLGAGLALNDLLARQGTDPGIRLLFQPAEERLPGGAVEVIDAGGLEDVAEIYALHCDPRLEVGRVGLVVGPITSATDRAVIALGGPGGHTARPEQTVDLVRLLAHVVTELPALVEARLGGPRVRLTFGSVHAGHAPNVIPSDAELQATVRTPDPGSWDALEDAVRAALAVLVDPTGAWWTLEYTSGHPPVVNDAAATGHMASAATALVGPDAVVPTQQSVGGDDFSWYQRVVPGCYARLGVRDPLDRNPPVDLHARCFDVDERSIATGVRLLVGTVLQARAASGRRS